MGSFFFCSGLLLFVLEQCVVLFTLSTTIPRASLLIIIIINKTGEKNTDLLEKSFGSAPRVGCSYEGWHNYGDAVMCTSL